MCLVFVFTDDCIHKIYGQSLDTACRIRQCCAVLGFTGGMRSWMTVLSNTYWEVRAAAQEISSQHGGRNGYTHDRGRGIVTKTSELFSKESVFLRSVNS